MIKEIEKLDLWLKENRKDFYALLNSPASETEIQQLESLVDVKLPEEFKMLLKWRNGQSSDAMDTFHPLTNEMFMGIDDIKYMFTELKELLHYGDIEEDIWRPTWLPFMSNGGGDHTCIDVSPENYGKIVSHNHEESDGRAINDSMIEWIIALNNELSKLNFESWDFEKCS